MAAETGSGGENKKDRKRERERKFIRERAMATLISGQLTHRALDR
jgi:hypothetical protein